MQISKFIKDNITQFKELQWKPWKQLIPMVELQFLDIWMCSGKLANFWYK